jgi:hypothetical protein
MSEIEKWIRKLGKMEENHLPELDHKDCGILADLLYELSNTINDLTLVVDLYTDNYPFDEHHKKKHKKLSIHASKLIGKPTNEEELREFIR